MGGYQRKTGPRPDDVMGIPVSRATRDLARQLGALDGLDASQVVTGLLLAEANRRGLRSTGDVAEVKPQLPQWIDQ